MFNTIKNERWCILVVVSDFSLGDEEKAEELMQQYAKAGIECIFIGFCLCENAYYFAEKVSGLRVKKDTHKCSLDLPRKFLEVYLNVQT